jgi:hypothetical protein
LLTLLRAGLGDSGGNVYRVLIAGRRVLPEGSVSLNTVDVGVHFSTVVCTKQQLLQRGFRSAICQSTARELRKPAQPQSIAVVSPGISNTIDY